MPDIEQFERGDLQGPPALPPQAAPDISALAPPEQEGQEGLTAGDMQITGQAVQLGMAAEKLLFKIAQLVPGFGDTVSQMVPLLRMGLSQSINTQGNGQTGAPPGAGGLL